MGGNDNKSGDVTDGGHNKGVVGPSVRINNLVWWSWERPSLSLVMVDHRPRERQRIKYMNNIIEMTGR